MVIQSTLYNRGVSCFSGATSDASTQNTVPARKKHTKRRNPNNLKLKVLDLKMEKDGSDVRFAFMSFKYIN